MNVTQGRESVDIRRLSDCGLALLLKAALIAGRRVAPPCSILSRLGTCLTAVKQWWNAELFAGDVKSST
ncbi:hypothetical protein BDZ89DRAFT_1151058 [Hymenopellis radicata]|nr:hypothetical protein BDZ89DRAFT_1151058 [Hymenopellis radicata]